MVSVSDELRQSFRAELREIADRLRTCAVWSSPSTGLALYTLRDLSAAAPITASGMNVCFPSGRLEEAPALAVAGFSACYSAPTEEQLARWKEGLKRLSKRAPFTQDRQTFAFRPPELIGVALGIRAIETESSPLRAWFCEVLASLPEKTAGQSIWHTLWHAYANELFGIAWNGSLYTKLEDWTAAELALALVLLNDVSPISLPDLPQAQSFELEKLLLRRLSVSIAADEREAERLAALYAGLHLSVASQLEQYLSPADGIRGSTRDAVYILERVCRNFDRLIRALNERHNGRPGFKVEDEYDVQDLMHALLLAHFEVVVREDPTPARAGNRSRVDFVLKKERVIVETKMTRGGLRQSEVHDELTADRDRYQTHPDCELLVCFVYDPEHLFHNAPAFELDLNIENGRPKMRAFVTPH